LLPLLPLLQFEGDWTAAHSELSDYLVRLMARMLQHLLQVCPELPQLPRSSCRPQQLKLALKAMTDNDWQTVRE
jgi:hypothetical protein